MTVMTLMDLEETDRADYEGKFLQHLNMRLEETLAINNGLRRQAGKEPMEEAPYLTEMEEEVGYESQLERLVLPLGVAMYLYVEDDETGITNDYRERYFDHLKRLEGLAFFEDVREEGEDGNDDAEAVPIFGD